jgi:alpha-tubulin suppressor-like RCC1 family protein
VAVVAACGSATRPPADAAVPDAAGDGGGCAAEQFRAVTGKCVSAVTSVAAGTVHTCALHADGKVTCWGQGAVIGPGLPAVTPPVHVALPGRATAVAVGIQAACALVEGGQVHCWGEQGKGPEGPAPVTREDGSTLDHVTRIAGGSVAFCAVTDSAVLCWGENKASELARPATMSFPPRTAVVVLDRPRPLIAATVAILVHDGSGELCGWGNNDSGLVPGERGIVERPTCAAAPTALQLTAGDGHACARRGGAGFSCWGSNAGGQLGNGDDSLMDVPLPGAAQTLPGEIIALAAGAYHTCALVGGGAVWCWGSNEQGECGRPSSAPVFSPAPSAVMRGAVAIGSGAGAQHTCAVLEGGAVVCWGSDSDGQLGSGAAQDATRFSADPVPVRW